MVKYNNIIKAVDDYIKCKATSIIRQIGGTGNETWKDSEWFDEQYISNITYDDGTALEFDEDGNITHLTLPNGFSKDFLGNDDYGFFREQRNRLIREYGEEAYDMFGRYADKWATWRGMLVNEYLRGDITKKQLKERFLETGVIEDMEFMLDNHSLFVKMCKENDLSAYGDFYTVRVTDRLHDNDHLEKRIVWDKGHNSSSSGADIRDLKDSFAKTHNPWTVVTVYEHDNGASRGAFIGDVVNLETWGGDWEHEVHTAPNTKFERLLIDETHRIIIQKPYMP